MVNSGPLFRFPHMFPGVREYTPRSFRLSGLDEKVAQEILNQEGVWFSYSKASGTLHPASNPRTRFPLRDWRCYPDDN